MDQEQKMMLNIFCPIFNLDTLLSLYLTVGVCREVMTFLYGLCANQQQGVPVVETHLFGYLRKMSLMTTMASCTT